MENLIGGNVGTPKLNIGLDDLEKFKCSCGNEYFMSVVKLFKVSALLSPTGESGVVPVQALICTKCNKEVSMDETEENDNGISLLS